MRLKELRSYLKELFPDEEMIDYCPNGLQIEGKDEVNRIVTAVSANLETIEAAIELQADVLIVHHGLFWQKDSYVIEGAKKKKIALLLQHGISLFAYHLPLDSHPAIGNNWRAAYEMGWTDLQPFCNVNGVLIGVKGMTNSLTPQELKTKLEEYYGHPATCALGGPEMIRSIALVSGGAHKSLGEAKQAEVDAFVTGSFDEPAWSEAFEMGIHFYAMGHSATERIGPIAMANYLAKELSLPCTFLDIRNPF